MPKEYSQSIISVKSQSSLTRYSLGSTFISMEFSERLKLAREAAKLTQEQLAQKSGVKQGTISKIERGDADSSTFTVQLAIACKVRPEWLAMESGPMIDEYGMAESIASKLDAKERAAWYRIGHSLSEPTEDSNGTQ
jgi:transcriptional regulator with XRE-family HTH domain